MAYESGRQKPGRDSLAEIARNTRKTATALLSGGGSGGAGLATEAKQDTQITELTSVNSNLISILNSILATQDVEVLLVIDQGAAGQIVQQIREYDQGTGTWTTRYEDVNGAPYIPVGPLQYVDASGVLNLILTELLDQGTALDNIETNTNRESWINFPGNSVTFTYYAGVTVANPSGDPNLETSVHSDGGGVVFTRTYYYDVNNEVISIVVT
jgi:hypothetical protein